ncbi:MAG: hypothetical protein DYG89_54615 [Caldilinea sp. CFX5]|nr:hypothetical protein [Caldilinea sp. CFX5]
MSLHAISTLRDRSKYPTAVVAAVICATTLLLMILSAGTVFAQTPPAAVAKTQTTPEDTATTIDTGIVVDAGNRYLVAIVVPGPAHGTAVELLPRDAAGTGSYKIQYTPGANRTDAVIFEYQLCTIATPVVCGAKATVSVSITAVNDGPVAGADSATTNQNQSVLIDVLANDNGGPNEPGDSRSLVAGSVSTPNPSGAAVIEGSQIRYTPVANFCSATPVTFTYLVQDGSGLQAAGTVSVTVRCPGNPFLSLSEPYAFSNHTFKIDVILNSPDVNVAAVDFDLAYPACLLDPDNPTNARRAVDALEDDATSNFGLPNFYFLKADLDTGAGLGPEELRFSLASVTGGILAGSGTPTRVIATIQFKASTTCGAANQTFDLKNDFFGGPTGAPIPGAAAQDKTTSVGGANQKPTNIALSNSSVPQGPTTPKFIGTLSTTDPDAGDTHTYATVPITANFTIAFGNELQLLNAGLAPGTYNLVIQTTDTYGGIFTKTFPIQITKVNVAPIANDDAPAIVIRGRKVITTLLTNDSDPDGAALCANCSIQSVTNGISGTTTNQGLSVLYVPTNPKATTDVFTYTLTDNDPAGALTDKAVVTLVLGRDLASNGSPVALGDCNKDGRLGGADLTATALELFDLPAGSNWYDTDLGTYAYSPYGCNSNADMFVNASDLSCTAVKMFNPAATCTAVMAAGSSDAAQLAVAGGVKAARGNVVNVPVTLKANGHAVSAAAFALDFDGDQLSFDASDANGDGIPDAVRLNVAASAFASVVYNAAESRLEFALATDVVSDGELASVALTVRQDADADQASVTLVESSLGSAEGVDVPVAVTDGSVQIGEAASKIYKQLLPYIQR